MPSSTARSTCNDYLYAFKFVVELGTLFAECEIERTPRDVVAVRLEPKDEGACQGVGKPFTYDHRYMRF